MSNKIINERKYISVNQAVVNLLGLRVPPKLLFDNQGKMIGVDEGDFTLNEFLEMAEYHDVEKAQRCFLKVQDAIDRKLLTTTEDGKITLHSFFKWTEREQLLTNTQAHSYNLKDVCVLLSNLADDTRDVDITISELAKDYAKVPAIGTTSKKQKINNGQSANSIQKRIVDAKRYIAHGNKTPSALPGLFTTLAFLIELHSITEPHEIVDIAMKIKNSKIQESEKKRLIDRWLDGEKTRVF
jgi:hypothetical protein